MNTNLLKNLKVLLVEDENTIRGHIASSMRYIVKEVVEAANGDEALNILKNFSPDIIITDLEMPVLNGVDFIKQVRESGSKVLIVVLTAHTNSEYLLPLIDAHIEKYIVKPINFEKMIDVLNQCSKKLQIRLKEFEISKGYSYDWNNKELKFKDKCIPLTKKEMAFVELLFKNSHRVVTYEELQNYIWEDSVMTDNAIRSLVKNLRGKLPEDIIFNLSGVGYKLA
ncbi:MAG: response regulator transcription factor [Sulfurospirillaceae bacterium]|jgi:DNA-binding response OmpR family regulator|nr:response regulator transcription factor [Sulfurospirillaceae bacterium]MCK9546066.1 response regulator transcription factor [Sulfurospirillaceae bacterium]MDY0237259.1 response regulator transcription factor [Campylobacterales bacterium]NLM99794.1 response regulator transcription factor [Campylobacteraceae bacterium]